MSVRVNLLPARIKARSRARRANLIVVLGVLAFACLLVIVYLGKRGAVDDAIVERDVAQTQVNELQAQVDALRAFQVLADEFDAGNTTLSVAMTGELAVARLLNDLALSLPSTASLTDLAVNRTGTTAEQGQISLGQSVADLTASGYSIEEFAPGVEGVLLQFGQIDGLIVTYLNTAAISEIGTVDVTGFDTTALLTDEVFTNRYDDGLPEMSQ